MNSQLFVQAGERRRLLPKEMTYVFSLEFELELATPHPPGPLLLHRKDPGQWSTFHVTGSEFVTTADGALREVPAARLKRAEDYLDATSGVASLRGRLLFDTDTSDTLAMQYTGVLDVPGGIPRWCKPNTPRRPATAFIQCRQEHAGAKYRWLVWNQLVGIGRANVIGKGSPLILHFSYDFYVAS